jgi:poly [ADP-ribose] polymerase
MNNVKNYLLPKSDTHTYPANKAKRIIEAEQDLLDTLRGQVQTQNQTQTQTQPQTQTRTIEELFGLIIEPATEDDINMIKKLLGKNKNQFIRAFKVINKNTEEKFNKYKKQDVNVNSKLFWHGSRNENWWSILQNGLLLRPATAIITGKMFGYGLYFADKAQKSINYTSLKGSYWTQGNSEIGYVGLYEVFLGKAKKITQHKPSYYDLNYDKITAEGYDSVFVEGGYDLINNEYVVYHEHQTTIRFLIEINNK